MERQGFVVLGFFGRATTATCGGEDGSRKKNGTCRIKGLRLGVYTTREANIPAQTFAASWSSRFLADLSANPCLPNPDSSWSGDAFNC